MPGLVVSSSCIALVSGAMKLVPERRSALRDFGADGIHREQGRQNDDAGKPHSTVIEADAVSEKPLSPIHSNSNLPLAVAVVKKVMNGLAAIAGNRSARKISVPL